MDQAAVQVVRVGNANPDYHLDSALTQLAAQIKKGECILFLGAGVHAPPEAPSVEEPSSQKGHLNDSNAAELTQPEYSYPPEVRPLMGGELATKLAKECDYATQLPHGSPYDLQRVSLCFEKSRGFGRAKLISRLNDYLMTNKKPSPILGALAEMPFRIIVTTNYDRLLEKSLSDKGKNPNVVVYDPNSEKPTRDIIDDPTRERPLVFKMHGDLSQSESIVITDEDYITFVQRMSDKDALHPVPGTIRFRMQRWSTLFVGYSLRDYNLRLLFRTLRWRLDPANFPISFSIDRDPDPLILQVWQNERQFITFVTQDLWSSVPYLFKEVAGKEFS